MVVAPPTRPLAGVACRHHSRPSPLVSPRASSLAPAGALPRSCSQHAAGPPQPARSVPPRVLRCGCRRGSSSTPLSVRAPLYSTSPACGLTRRCSGPAVCAGLQSAPRIRARRGFGRPLNTSSLGGSSLTRADTIICPRCHGNGSACGKCDSTGIYTPPGTYFPVGSSAGGAMGSTRGETPRMRAKRRVAAGPRRGFGVCSFCGASVKLTRMEKHMRLRCPKRAA